MKIVESKNLKYDIMPWRGPDDGYDKFNPVNCILERFSRDNDKLSLYFKNNSKAVIRGKNIEGGKEINLIEDKLDDFLEKNYEEIINADF